MAMISILVTAYSNPDLDGTACAIAYAELLRKENKVAISALFGTPHREAQFVFETFNIPQPENAEKILPKNPDIILVDASDLRGISNKINPLKVIELIDHRKINEADGFPNAKIQIELVGSAATLIAEKFFNSNQGISSSSAALLYSAIISNTVNFQANVTTDRDREMAQWLLNKFSIPHDYIHSMFAYKSTFTEPLIDVIDHDFATFEFSKLKIGIGQLEIVNVTDFISTQKEIIEIVLQKIKKERNLDIIFLSTIDLEKANNTFVTIDEQSKSLLEKTLNASFNANVAVKNGIMMRKTITPLLKDALQQPNL
jgi:manganese-dependent inorganic pyrophosphatase